MDGKESWQSLLKGEGIEGWESGGPCFWRDGETVVGSDGGYGDRLMTGKDDWRDYEFAADVTIIEGGMAQLHYRITVGHRCWYTLDLLPQAQSVRLAWADNRKGGPGLVSVVTNPLKLEYGRAYELRVVAEGSTLTGFVDGREIGNMSDARYPSGRVGLGLYNCRASFRAPRIRLLR